MTKEKIIELAKNLGFKPIHTDSWFGDGFMHFQLSSCIDNPDDELRWTWLQSQSDNANIKNGASILIRAGAKKRMRGNFDLESESQNIVAMRIWNYTHANPKLKSSRKDWLGKSCLINMTAKEVYKKLKKLECNDKELLKLLKSYPNYTFSYCLE